MTTTNPELCLATHTSANGVERVCEAPAWHAEGQHYFVRVDDPTPDGTPALTPSQLRLAFDGVCVSTDGERVLVECNYCERPLGDDETGWVDRAADHLTAAHPEKLRG